MGKLLTRHLNSWLTLLLISGLLMADFFTEHHYNSDYLEARHLEVRADLLMVRDRLQQSIDNDVQMIRGLVSLIASHPNLTQQEFAQAAAPLFGSGSNLRNIGAAPGMVIRMMYPVEGNEAAIGLDYRKTPDQFEMAEKARTSGQMILAGPLSLVQGGTGLIGRFPVYTLDQTGKKRFWGLISAVIDVDALYRHVGLLGTRQPLALAIKDLDDPGGKIIFGQPQLFDDQPETVRIELPGRTWQLAAIPKGGWPTRADNILEIRLLLIVASILILIPFLFLLHTLNKRNQLERDLRASRKKYQRLVDDMGDKFIVYSHKADTGELLHVSDGVKTVIGKSWDEVIGQPWSEVVDWQPESLQRAQEYVSRMINKEIGFAQFEMDYTHPDGTKRTMLVSAHPFSDDGDRISHINGIVEDITERKQAEKALRASEGRLRQSQKMEAVGTLVGGIAHEFNNMLVGISGNIYLAKEKNERGSDAYEKLDRAESMCFRAAGMIQKLLVFSGKDFVSNRPQTVDMRQWLDEGLKLAGSALTAKTELIYESSSDDTLLVSADPNQLQQILVNLLNNARDASAERKRPRIRVSLDAGPADNDFRNRHKRFNGSEYVRLTVQDNGTGIAADKLEKIFEPFFTTREVGKGTGLGLSVTQGLVQSLYGAIEVESEVGKGTSFYIYLPRHYEATAIPSETAKSPQQIERGHGETILFADDEPEVLKMTAEVLEGLGYNVVPVHNGEEAVKLFELRKGGIDMLLLDVMMPQLSGPDAARKIRAASPDIPLLFCTGYSANEMRDEMDGLSDFSLIGKPMQISELSQVIRKLLASK